MTEAIANGKGSIEWVEKKAILTTIFNYVSSYRNEYYNSYKYIFLFWYEYIFYIN